MVRICDMWAIRCGEGLGFVGIYRMDHQQIVEPWRALTTALFGTRREARDHLPRVKGPADRGLYPNARVVRVRVTVSEEG